MAKSFPSLNVLASNLVNYLKKQIKKYTLGKNVITGKILFIQNVFIKIFQKKVFCYNFYLTALHNTLAT